MKLALSRFLATLVDVGVASIPLWLMSPLTVIMILSDTQEQRFIARFLLVLYAAISVLIYNLVQVIRTLTGKQTYGRALLGLAVLDVSTGLIPSRKQVLLRAALAFAGIILLYYIGVYVILGWVFAYMLPGHRSVIDSVAGTKVFWATPPLKPEPVVDVPRNLVVAA
jgi:uncharacterized RDD family membrane protein YckC